MMQESTAYHLARMKRKYQWTRGIEILLWSFAIGLMAFYFCRIISLETMTGAAIALTLISIAVVLGARRVHLFSISERDLAMYLNRRYPALQESADLLLKKNDDLSGLPLLQKVRTAEQFEAIYPTIKLPHHLGRAVGVFGLSVALSAFSVQSDNGKGGGISAKKYPGVGKENLPTSVKNSTISIFPPAYTHFSKQSSESFNLNIPEASKVVWEITFENAVVDPRMIFSGRDTVILKKTRTAYRAERPFTSSGFYQLIWTNPDSSTQYSDYYKIEVIPDRPPSLAIENLDQFVVLSERDNLKINLKSRLTDDYGLSRSQIVATVSKGSGEAIKFREEKLSFDSPLKITGKNVVAIKALDLTRIGLQPGDELYFYIEAEDNKTPLPNRARTETYFIALQDTATAVTSVEAGMAADVMPEYFRSQRQIIIDSEKLLREKQRITKENFNNRSNGLAHDQKVLRLRYGEFLGEEFQSSVGHISPFSEGEAEDVKETFGHSHDSENEHNLVDERQSTQDKKVTPLDDFIHAHDGEAEATFFAQSVKAKLKAAIAIMWDAELYLRLNQPQKSLPYQYKILKLLKEVSQDSRLYVHRTGFDPPPLKEEKRLTGDLKEIRNSTFEEKLAERTQYPNIRAGLTTVETLLRKDSLVLSQNQKNDLIKAGQQLGEIELHSPGGHLGTLSLLNNVIHGEGSSKEKRSSLLKIRETFFKVLPRETMTPQAKAATSHDLDLQFLRKLQLSNP